MAFDAVTGALNLLETEQRVALYWVRDARQLPGTKAARRCFRFCDGGLQCRGFRRCMPPLSAHRLAGVLIAGRGGAGKSTTALACLNSKLAYVSDDHCLLATQPSPCAWSLYNTGKLDAESLRLLPHFSRYIHNAARSREEKALFFSASAFSRKDCDELSPARRAAAARLRATRHDVATGVTG